MTGWLKPRAPVCCLAACPDGLGSHRLFGPGGRLFRKPAQRLSARPPLHIVSPATAADEGRAVFWERVFVPRDVGVRAWPRSTQTLPIVTGDWIRRRRAAPRA